jgi:glutamate-1-semialdehyde 2,1-aminomutase
MWQRDLGIDMKERKRSKELYDRAKLLMPGGVSSPVRAFKPYPSYIAKGSGAKIWDVDGNEYIDYCMGFGPLILGHADPDVVNAVREQAPRGMLYGAPIALEIEMAELVRGAFPSVEMLRIVNTGTEATMHAIRVARGFTGRKKFIKVEGAFHGAHDSVLVKAGSGATTHSAPDSLGVPEEVTSNTLLVPFNDLDAVRRAIMDNKGEVAAIITEPVIGNAGPIPPEEDYLQGLRELTTDNDILLILDEVITGFRLAPGGAQQRFGVRADMTILGKVVGGGLPIGIFGGSEEIMSMVSPTGKVYQAGTFSGNPMSLTAGIATIKKMRTLGYEELERKGEQMRYGLAKVIEEMGIPFRAQGIGSMFQLFLTDGEVKNYAGARSCDTSAFWDLFLGLMNRGIYLPPSQFETNFISTAHTDAEIDLTVEAYGEALEDAI